MKKLIVTTNQLDRLIPQEDIDFVKKYKEETGHYPNYRELQHNPSYVRDFIPSHQKKIINLELMLILIWVNF